MKYIIDLKHTITATLILEAKSKREARQKYEDGDYDVPIEFDEEYYGGIPWSIV